MSRTPYSLLCGTATATDTAAALGTACGFESILIKADSANPVAVFVGDAASQPYALDPGDSVGLGVDNLSVIYIKTGTASAAGVAWLVTK